MRGKLSSNKEIVMNQWNDAVFVHIHDYSRCWDSGTYKKELLKSVSLRWDQVLLLKSAIDEMGKQAEHMLQSQQVSQLNLLFIISLL